VFRKQLSVTGGFRWPVCRWRGPLGGSVAAPRRQRPGDLPTPDERLVFWGWRRILRTRAQSQRFGAGP